jgi:hypothetical protein
MRRFQNILYVTCGTADETDSLKQVFGLARTNATTLQVLAVCPMLPKTLGKYEAGFEAWVGGRTRTSAAKALAELKMAPDEVHTT